MKEESVSGCGGYNLAKWSPLDLGYNAWSSRCSTREQHLLLRRFLDLSCVHTYIHTYIHIFFFQNGSIALASASMHTPFFIRLFTKAYNEDTKINSKPPFQRQLAIPTKVMKGTIMNKAITLTIHQHTSSKIECFPKLPIGGWEAQSVKQIIQTRKHPAMHLLCVCVGLITNVLPL
jgi:hypothetical protein